jgi:hypothetical protein
MFFWNIITNAGDSVMTCLFCDYEKKYLVANYRTSSYTILHDCEYLYWEQYETMNLFLGPSLLQTQRFH